MPFGEGAGLGMSEGDAAGIAGLVGGSSFGDVDSGGIGDDSFYSGGPLGEGILATLGLGRPSLESNKAMARQLALASIPPRLAQLMEGITSLTQLSNASPQALTQRLAPQIEQVRTALQQIFRQSAQRFGQFGGGQVQREQARGAEALGGQLTRLFGALPEQARNALIALIENFQLLPQPATPIAGVSTQPFNAGSVLQNIQGGAALGELGVRAYRGLSGAPPPSPVVSPSSAAGVGTAAFPITNL